ncbi:hypothetical protein [Zymobacter palmae]|uniref:Predicted dehydrogenases n=1 Tax=Zymobacter palmae TaxID=33074 RepID=A0A348HDT6_9GAMM|nr:hypothetical protein [Zymobacter palmae]BBG29788.1 predicted dehydrogenases [Zymobacter palmae]
MALDLYVYIEHADEPLWVPIDDSWHDAMFSSLTPAGQYRQLSRLHDYYADCCFDAHDARQLLDDIIALCERHAISSAALTTLTLARQGASILSIQALGD